MNKLLRYSVFALAAFAMSGCNDDWDSSQENDKGKFTFQVIRPESNAPGTRGDWGYEDTYQADRKLPYIWDKTPDAEKANIFFYYSSRGSYQELPAATFSIDDRNNATTSVAKPGVGWGDGASFLTAFYPYTTEGVSTFGVMASVNYSMPASFEQTGKNSQSLSKHLYMYGTTKNTGNMSGGDLELKHLTSLMRFIVINQKGDARTITGVKMTALKGTAPEAIFPSNQAVVFYRPAIEGSQVPQIDIVAGREPTASVGVTLTDAGSTNWNKLAASKADNGGEAEGKAGRVAAYALTLPTQDLSDLNLKFEVSELLANGRETTYSYILAGSSITTLNASDKPAFAAGYYYTFNLNLTQNTLAVDVVVPTTKPDWGDTETSVMNWENHLRIVGGAGSESDPLKYEVYTAIGLKEIARFISDRTPDSGLEKGGLLAPGSTDTYVPLVARFCTNITLAADIDLNILEPDPTKNNWTPIGNYMGNFDGGGHVLRGLRIVNGEGLSLVGLISAMRDGTMKNLTLADVYIDVASAPSRSVTSAGALMGCNVNLTIENCHVTAGSIIKGKDYVGGLVGSSDNTVMRACSNAANLTGMNVGGIAGTSYESSPSMPAPMLLCSNTGTLTGTNYVGGIVGVNSGVSVGGIYGCWNAGELVGANCGGIVGEGVVIATIEGCYTSSDKIEAVGSSTINNCVTGVTDWENATTNLQQFIVTNDLLKSYSYVFNKNIGFPMLINENVNGESVKLIYNEADLFEFFAEMGNSNLNAKLMANITMTQTYNITGGLRRFTGIFDGNGKTITGLKMHAESNDDRDVYLGFVGDLMPEAVIKNLTLKDVSISNTRNENIKVFSGAIAGLVENGYVENCHVIGTSTVQGSGGKGAYVGGIMGYLDGRTAMGCSNIGCSVRAEGGVGEYNRAYAGGITGVKDGLLIACSNTGNVVSEHVAGGISGVLMNEPMAACWSTGTVTVKEGNQVGGISGVLGIPGTTVESCYTTQDPGTGGGTKVDKIAPLQWSMMNDYLDANAPDCPYRFNTSIGKIYRK